MSQPTDNSNLVLCDVDQVVADLYPEWFGRYNTEFKDMLTSEQVTDWNIEQFVKPECGTGIFKYLAQRDLYDGVLPMPGALEGVKYLRNLGYRVVFVTAGNAHMGGRKLLWLIEHGFLDVASGVFHHPDYIECFDKSILSEVGVAIIDDYAENLRHHRGAKLLFSQPHNKRAEEDDSLSFYRVDSWRDIKLFFINLSARFSWEERERLSSQLTHGN